MRATTAANSEHEQWICANPPRPVQIYPTRALPRMARPSTTLMASSPPSLLLCFTAAITSLLCKEITLSALETRSVLHPICSPL